METIVDEQPGQVNGTFKVPRRYKGPVSNPSTAIQIKSKRFHTGFKETIAS
jgi:hypothetical protein